MLFIKTKQPISLFLKTAPNYFARVMSKRYAQQLKVLIPRPEHKKIQLCIVPNELLLVMVPLGHDIIWKNTQNKTLVFSFKMRMGFILCRSISCKKATNAQMHYINVSFSFASTHGNGRIFTTCIDAQRCVNTEWIKLATSADLRTIMLLNREFKGGLT